MRVFASSEVRQIDSLKKGLFDLGVTHADMSFDFMPKDKLSHTGSDRVSLLFSFNKGYPLKPIIHIASGGEIARLMLCIKKYLFSINNFSTIIFDEIDGGVSAHIGRKMGRILQQE